VTNLLEYFEPECLIHDWEFARQPRTWWHFSIANIRMIVNAFLYACATLPPVSPEQTRRARLRVILRITARAAALALLCQLGGWRGYKTTVINQPQTKDFSNA